jgi:hypothetical protein
MSFTTQASAVRLFGESRDEYGNTMQEIPNIAECGRNMLALLNSFFASRIFALQRRSSPPLRTAVAAREGASGAALEPLRPGPLPFLPQEHRLPGEAEDTRGAPQALGRALTPPVETLEDKILSGAGARWAPMLVLSPHAQKRGRSRHGDQPPDLF